MPFMAVPRLVFNWTASGQKSYILSTTDLRSRGMDIYSVHHDMANQHQWNGGKYILPGKRQKEWIYLKNQTRGEQNIFVKGQIVNI